ncbi:FAD-dependent oxidoreductase [Haloterrigena alkaliphila]|uniref:FAD-dependent oxidoreductase n=1 Tax=Haloterrigena alkaliphila TaxID=2816475 RepID=A0A8A2VF80_9EURY|nr:FAD-dependent oxidoreductase [Haloterrigena alkaliphila]QSX00172.1 FAD-dependent oxidoreductase [Haloterrigena alkaliphila]
MIGVVGGTAAGLAAAYGLTERGHDVRVFEPSDRLGGIAATTAADGTGGDPLERVPVSFVRPRDEAAIDLLADLGLADRLEWRPTRTAMYVDGTVHPVDAPWEFLAYPPLSLSDTARLATLQSGIDRRGFTRRRPRFDAYDPAAYADVPAEAFVREHAGDAVYERFYGPLLAARFGDRASTVSAAWVLEHCRGERERTRFGREYRGQFADSSAVLVDALADAIGRERIVTNARVTALEGATGDRDATAGDGSDRLESLTVERDGVRETYPVDAVVLASATDRHPGLTRFEPPVPVRTRTCVRVSTTAETPLTDAYRVTMVDDAPFGELVTPTVLGSSERDDGHRYCLLDGGAAADRSSATVERRWLEALATRFARFDRNDLAGIETTRIRQPVPERGTAVGVTTPVAASTGGRTTVLADGVYGAGPACQRQFPERSVGAALETGLTCGMRVADELSGVSKRQSASH